MNKEAYNFTEMTLKEVIEAKENYGADTEVEAKMQNAFYNVGMDTILRDMAALVLVEKGCELDQYEKSLEEYRAYQNTFETMAKIMSGHERAHEMFWRLNDQKIDCSEAVEKEYFIQGFLAGYKLSRNANSI